MSRIARICWALTILYWCGLFTLTHIPGPKLPPIHVDDKFVHSTTYGVLAIAIFLSIRLKWGWRASDIAVLVLGILLIYGAFDEISQPPFNRTCDIHDWHADAAGASVAVVLMTLVFRRR